LKTAGKSILFFTVDKIKVRFNQNFSKKSEYERYLNKKNVVLLTKKQKEDIQTTKMAKKKARKKKRR